MSRKTPLSQDEINFVNGALVRICESLDMEFAVMCMQGTGPLEIFRVNGDPKWESVTKEISAKIKEHAAENRADQWN